MVDLHSHVLGGIDDGPDDLRGSLDIIRAAAAGGTRTLVATPHVRPVDFPGVRLEEIASRCERLNEAVPPGSDVRIVPGGEVDLIWAQSASREDLRLASYGQRGTDLLLETPYAPLTAGFEDLVFRISLQGYRILLAHPERNPTFQRDPDRLARLVDRDILIQVTARSMTPDRKVTRRLCLDLAERGLVHVIASDAHSSEPPRSPDLSGAVAAVEEVAPGRGTWMVTSAPAAILAGDPLPAPPRPPPRARRRLRLRFG